MGPVSTGAVLKKKRQARRPASPMDLDVRLLGLRSLVHFRGSRGLVHFRSSRGIIIDARLIIGSAAPVAAFPSFAFRFCGSRRSRRRGALDAHLQGRNGVMMETELDFMLAQGPNRHLQVDFLLIERDVELGLELVGDGSGGHRAEHLPVIPSLDGNHGRELGNALGEFAHGIEFVGFPLGAAAAQGFDVALVGRREGNGKN